MNKNLNKKTSSTFRNDLISLRIDVDTSMLIIFRIIFHKRVLVQISENGKVLIFFIKAHEDFKRKDIQL